ncbi:SH3 domain-containing protein [Neobacillus sp. PS3-34]|uniref:SH3 domain-containing protein n=1 Tax=Neobacillus sp. PS3-34 TaxID=3070678 RepID=UPI0027DEBB67|nr:SH3 domain-containing protein [Neobacillus sp. PS3-34]WML49852.1 SH3 domain-containing protein [Neobacillus sp. PS3-34]
MKNFGKAILLSTSILAGASAIPGNVFGVGAAEASSIIKTSKITFQTTANLVLRSGAGTTYRSFLNIPKGKTVTSTERIGIWYKVAYTYKVNRKNITKIGWVSSAFLKEFNQYSATAMKYYFIKSPAKLYSTPDTKRKEVYKIGGNNGFASTQKVINSLGQTWYRISYNGKLLYVNSNNVTEKPLSSFSETRFKAKVDTYLFASYGNANKKLVKIPQGSIVSSFKKIGEWYSVTINKVSGYIYAGDLLKNNEVTYQTMKTNETFYFTNKSAKLYSTPDSSKKEIYTIGRNNGFASTQKALNSLGETWYQISFNDQVLFVKNSDVSENTFSALPQSTFKATIDTYVYHSYGDGHQKLTVIPKDTLVISDSRIGDWYTITFNGVSGYFYIGDFSKLNDVPEEKIQDTTFVTTTAINLNQTPDEFSTVLETIPSAKIIMASYKTSNGWYKVTSAGKSGYVPGTSIKQVKTGDPLTGRDSYQFIDLRTQSPVTANQINDYISAYVNAKGKASVLTGKGQAFIDAGRKYGVNSLYLAAHAIHESAFGTSQIALGKNNLFGFGAVDQSPYIGAYRFASVDLCIDYIAREIKTTYLNPSYIYHKGPYLGFSTKDMNNIRIGANSEGMNFYYASDPNWGKAIAGHMEKILSYDKTYYSQAAIDTNTPSRPIIPEGSDIFPSNILSIANKDLILNTSKGIHDAVKTINKGSNFLLLEKTNDKWVKVMVDNTIYWTDDIKFYDYRTYFSVQNLGRTIDTLNVRSTPTTAINENIKSKLNMNDYVSIMLNNDGTPVMDSTGSWYNILLADGTTGWVSASYISRELKK